MLIRYPDFYLNVADNAMGNLAVELKPILMKYNLEYSSFYERIAHSSIPGFDGCFFSAVTLVETNDFRFLTRLCLVSDINRFEGHECLRFPALCQFQIGWLNHIKTLESMECPELRVLAL